MSSFRESVRRAAILLGTPAKQEGYVIFKLSPVPPRCCCFHCWPDAWRAVNDYLGSQGPIEDEGNILIQSGDAAYVLECHEDGPEIVVYLSLVAASVTLVKSVVDLITVLVKGLKQKDQNQKAPVRLKFIRRRFVERNMDEEVMELDIPLSGKDVDAIGNLFRHSIMGNTEQDSRRR